jgi:FdhE protein
MQRTTPRLRPQPAARLADLERQRPEWHTWLTLLGEVEHAVISSGQSPVASRQSPVTSRQAPVASQEPLLHQCTLDVDAGQVHRLLLRLLSIAASGDVAGGATLGHYRPSQADAVTLLTAAVRQQLSELGALADAAGVERGALTSIAHLAAFPLLQACGRLLEDHVPQFWPHGYCPICAAWPILAERRGLDRTRRMRCGRCGGEWELQWLSCVYCGEREHERLGSLIPEGSGETLKVETCSSCQGYLKSVATLQGIPPFELLLQDLETVELDLVALERGFGRPEECGFSLEVRLA